jgi:hypothetical protein
MANGRPLATLDDFTGDLGIPERVKLPEVGIRRASK